MRTLIATLALLPVVLVTSAAVHARPPSTPTVASKQPASSAAKPLINVDAKGLALEGYDPVAYFTEQKSTKGRPELFASHQGATYHFASAEHRDLFVNAPSRYAPAFGGYCGYAASIGKVRPVKPTLWSIVDNRLILQHSKGAVELWEKDIPFNLARADRFWPRLVEVKAGQKNPIDSLLGASALPEAR